MLIGREADDRQVGFGVGAEDLSAVFSLVGEPDDDLVGALDDMEVGEDEAALVDDDAGPQAGLAKLGAGAGALGAEELVEEVPEERIVAAGRQVRLAPRLGALDGAEMHDGGTDVFRHADEALL